MPYQVIDNEGKVIEARFDIDGPTIVFESSGGTRGARKATNHQYMDGLKILLARIRTEKLKIEDAWVDSTRVQNLPLEQRRIAEPSDFTQSPEQLALTFGRNMRGVGQNKSTKPGSGNNRKCIRIRIAGEPSEFELKKVLKGQWTAEGQKTSGRLSNADLEKVNSDHIWQAAKGLRDSAIGHKFSPSTGYDLICDDGERLDPKAVFGAAASIALGFEVLPKHFESGGEKKSHKKLEAAGFAIVPKDSEPPKENDSPAAPDDLEWAEGKIRRVIHLKQERSKAAAKTKKDQFERRHGRLFCERCGLVPSEEYGESGDACIEVHHTIPLAKVKGGQSTRLEDLQCLCANCHRVVHREMRQSPQ